jgi:hypothetical protein
MWGQKMVGHFASRCDDVLNGGKCEDGEDDVTTFGDVPCLAVIGDFKQLKPVLDNSLCVRASTNKLCMLGKLAYQSMNRVLLLDTPMRQNHTSSLFTHLTNLRDAKLSQVDVDFWHTRQLNKITNNRRVDLDKWSLANSDVLYATCFNKDRDNLNSDYIQTMDHVFVVKATCAGVHAIAANHIKAGPLKSIPRLSYLAVGMMVKVTTNYVPELGIFNHARGTVVDIIYENGYNPEACDVHPVVVVNLPDYTGPPMSADFGLNGRGKWIAFTADTKICDCFSCSRVGIPVVCAKADSIHSIQGVTVGPEKAIKRLLIHWSSKAEGKWPGIFYVATGRAQDSGDVALAFDVTSELLSCIGKSKGWQELHDEVIRLELKAREFRELRSTTMGSRIFPHRIFGSAGFRG